MCNFVNFVFLDFVFLDFFGGLRDSKKIKIKEINVLFFKSQMYLALVVLIGETF